jgi:hypothetical protein
MPNETDTSFSWEILLDIVLAVGLLALLVWAIYAWLGRGGGSHGFAPWPVGA